MSGCAAHRQCPAGEAGIGQVEPGDLHGTHGVTGGKRWGRGMLRVVLDRPRTPQQLAALLEQERLSRPRTGPAGSLALDHPPRSEELPHRPLRRRHPQPEVATMTRPVERVVVVLAQFDHRLDQLVDRRRHQPCRIPRPSVLRECAEEVRPLVLLRRADRVTSRGQGTGFGNPTPLRNASNTGLLPACFARSCPWSPVRNPCVLQLRASRVTPRGPTGRSPPRGSFFPWGSRATKSSTST